MGFFHLFVFLRNRSEAFPLGTVTSARPFSFSLQYESAKTMSRLLKNTALMAFTVVAFFVGQQHAQATDRFNVTVRVVSFKSLVDMDPTNNNDEYFLTVNADVPNAGRKSLRNYELKGPPKKTLRANGVLTFQDIKEPSRSKRTITISCDVSEQDVIETGPIFKKKKKTVYTDMGTATGKITDDLFREADRSSKDVASRTVTLTSKKYRMEVLVTVIEVD